MQDGSFCMVCVKGNGVVVQQETMKRSTKRLTSLAWRPNSSVSEKHIRILIVEVTYVGL